MASRQASIRGQRSSNRPQARNSNLDGVKRGDSVKTLVTVGSIPAESVGIVEADQRPAGLPFLAVRFENGRLGFYALNQLRQVSATFGS